MVIDIWCCLSDISIILVSDSHIDLARVWIPDLHNKEIIIRGLLEKYWYLPRRIKQFFCKKYSSVLEGLNILNNHTRMCVRNYLRKKKQRLTICQGHHHGGYLAQEIKRLQLSTPIQVKVKILKEEMIAEAATLRCCRQHIGMIREGKGRKTNMGWLKQQASSSSKSTTPPWHHSCTTALLDLIKAV